MSKQTAIEFLIKAFQGAYGEKVINVISVQVEQAKEMYKEQIIKANEDASTNELGEFLNGKQYYTETYESNGSDDHLPDVRKMVEISDEEITKLANEYILYNDSKRQWVIEGMKLYREQLKQK